ncbi:2OG-Fe(II) oxygenase [Aliikangiella sp. IMCC44653]
MKFSDLSEELQQWVTLVVNDGHPKEVILKQLQAYGHPKEYELAVDDYLAQLEAAGQTIRPSSSSVLAAAPSTQRAADRDVHILMAINNPRIVLFANLLSDAECDELIAQSKSRLTPSTVVNPVTGSYDKDEVRTSYGAAFYRGENKLIQTIEARIAALIGCPVSRGEPIQTLNYAIGAEYEPHFDYFDPEKPGNQKTLSMGGQRFATLIMYLNDVEAGGSTVFPKLGLDIMPRKGNAIFFSYSNDSGLLDPNTFHGGSPVTQGEKWIATKWIRLNDYTGPMI